MIATISWVISTTVLCGMNSLITFILFGMNYIIKLSTAWYGLSITLLSTVWNEFSYKIKYYYSKNSYNVKSLAYILFLCEDKDSGRF